jgi:predicted Zn-dependent peptidase
VSAPYDAPMHRVTTLPGGLRVASEQMPGVRSVSVGYWIDAGARDERPDQRGLAHFIEHMLFKGGARHDAMAIAELFDELGAELNAATAKDSTLLYARVLDDDLPVALDAMSDMLRSPSWSEIEQEREVVLEEIAMVEDAPQDGVHDLATLAMFGEEDPLGHPILGEPPVIASAQIANVAEFHRAAYGDPSIVLAAAGNVDHDRLCELAASFLGASPAPLELPHRPSAGGLRPGRRFQLKETEQFHVCVCGPGLERAHDDRFVLSLLDVMLGGTASSRLFQEIRERRGMAYSVYSYHSAYAECGQVGVYVGTRPENLEECLSIVREETASLAAGDLRPGELERAKRHLTGRVLLSLESSSARMSRLGKNLLSRTEILEPDEVAARVEAVTPEQIASLAARLWAPEHLSAAGIGPDEDVFDAAVAVACPTLQPTA